MGIRPKTLTQNDSHSLAEERANKLNLRDLVKNLEWRDLDKNAKKEKAINAYQCLSF
jgi:hypothetical protein